jgi:hypothetical protein
MFVVTTSASCATRRAIEVPLYTEFEAEYDIIEGSENDWRKIELRWAPDDADSDSLAEQPFATLYRESDPTAVARELSSMSDALEGVEPRSGSQWVVDHLRDVKTIYRFTPHSGDEEALDALRAVLIGIQNETRGLVYAEGEGWSNPDGDQITWEFSEQGNEGEWWVAVLNDAGEWQSYWIELSDPADQRAFREGRVLEGREDDRDEDEDEPPESQN